MLFDTTHSLSFLFLVYTRPVDYPPSSSSSEEEELCDSMREEDKGKEEEEDGQCSKVTLDLG